MNVVAAEEIDSNYTAVEDFQLPSQDVITIDTSDMYVFEKGNSFNATVSNADGSPVYNQSVIFSVNGVNYTRFTDLNGIASLTINLNPGTYDISTIVGNSINNNSIYVRDTETTFIDDDLSNEEIQNIIDSADEGDILEFIGDSYENIALTISKQLTLVSYNGAILNGDGRNPVIRISSLRGSGTTIQGLTLSGGSAGISVFGLISNVNILNNTFIGNTNGIEIDNARYTNITGNYILNSANYGIYLKNAESTLIFNNTIADAVDGIYFDVDNIDTDIFNNTITGCSDYAIKLEGSGEESNIYWNRIENNENGVYIGCDATNLNFRYNAILNNEINGVYIANTYRKANDGSDFVMEDNSIYNNGDFNILARDAIYYTINIQSNWLGSTDPSQTRVCSKVISTPYGLSFNQVDSGTVQIIVGDGNGPANVPSFSVSVSFDGGTTYVVYRVEGGAATIHVSNEDGTIDVRTGDRLSFTLEDYVPYVEPENPPSDPEPGNPTTPTTPTNPNTPGNGGNGNGTSNNGGSGSEGSGDGSSSASGDLSASSANSQSSSASSSAAESAASASPASSEPASQSASSSQSVTRSINIEEEDIVRIAGVGVIIVIIILIIGFYYRNDIRDMINRKNEK